MLNDHILSKSSINLNMLNNTYDNILPEAGKIITVPKAKFDRVMEQHFRYD